MIKNLKKLPLISKGSAKGYDTVLPGIVDLLESARRASARSVNTIMTSTYWEIGRRIVESEQAGKDRVEYKESLLKHLSSGLEARFGPGFSERNLEMMRLFYLGWPVSQTLSKKSEDAEQTNQFKMPSESSQPLSVKSNQKFLIKRFPLAWSHYVRLLNVSDEARAFYEGEALRYGWSVRELEHQIEAKSYEQTLLLKNKTSMLKRGIKPLPAEQTTPGEEIKDTPVLEFLGLKNEYSESSLEEALVNRLEAFLLGEDLALTGRKLPIQTDIGQHSVDLLFFHRRLHCLVIIDLKLGRFSDADMEQMSLCLDYAREHWAHEDENPPLGIILRTQKDTAEALYVLERLQDKALIEKYRISLPDEKSLASELLRLHRVLEMGMIGEE